MPTRRDGTVLLEVLVALTILAFAAVAVLGASNQIAATAVQVAVSEATVLRADQYMTAISLWPRTELDRHLGQHRRGEWVLDVDHAAPVEYEVRILDSTARHEWLHTTLYRPMADVGGDGR